MIYNEYETTYITVPELGEDVQQQLLEKVGDIIKENDGEVFVQDPWGRRRLAYPINNHNHGYYVCLNYVGPSTLPAELERVMRLDDKIIRYLTVKLGYNINTDNAREEATVRHQQWVEKREAQAASMDRPRRGGSR